MMGGEMIGYVVERSMAFGVVFLVASALWLLVRRWMSSHVGSVWFLLPLVVLVVPVERWIPNPWAGGNPIGTAARAVLPDQVERVFADANTDGFLDPSLWAGPASAAVVGSGRDDDERAGAWSPSGADWLLAVWLFGFGAFLVRLIRGQRLVPEMLEGARRLVQSSECLPVATDDLCRGAGVTQSVIVFESADFESPAVWTGAIPTQAGPNVASQGGSFTKRPAAIILPEGLGARLSQAELRWVLLHELAHLARRDTQVELIQRLIGAAFFFHPLVWATNRIAREYREMACDDAALARCEKSERARCARALFEVVAHASALSSKPSAALRRYRTTHAMASLFNSKKLTRKRIMRLIELDRPLSRGLRISALLPLFFVSGVALAAARFPSVHLQEPSLEDITDGFYDNEIVDHNEEDVTVDAMRKSVGMATDWLMRNQDKDGGWSFNPDLLVPKNQEATRDLVTGKPASARAKFERYHSDVALTALAVQALTKRGAHEPNNNEVKSSIERGVRRLLTVQDLESGIFGEPNWMTMVAQSLATEALAKAHVTGLEDEVMTSLTASIAFLEGARNPYEGWRYAYPPTGENDARITGYVTLALAAAADEVKVYAAPVTFAGAMNYLSRLEDPKSGRTHYMEGVPFAYRMFERRDSFPAERAEVPTAMHMRLRNYSGMESVPKGAMEKAVEVLVGKRPTWSLSKGAIDFTYWWQGTEALASRPERDDAWKRWRWAVKAALVWQQVTEGPGKGTWPTVDAWSETGLEVYTTATGALALYAVLDAE